MLRLCRAEKGPAGLGKGLLIWLIGLTSVGAVGCWWAAERFGELLGAAGFGWLVSGILACLGWLTGDRALRGGQAAFLRYVLGGMLLRLFLAGVAVAVVVGLGWSDPIGFVAGLLIGVVAFQTIEVCGLMRSSRRRALSAAGETSVEEA